MANISSIINPVEAQRLRLISDFQAMLTDDYLTDTAHIQTEFIYNKFFKEVTETKRTDRLALLNIGTGIVGLISENIADYAGEPKTNIPVDIHQFVQARSWGGYAVMKCRLVKGELKIEYASPDGYVSQDDGTEILLTYIDVTKDQKSTKEKYVLKQTYSPGQVVNELFKYQVPIFNTESNVNSWFQGTQVELTEIDATAELLPFEKTGLTQNPIVVVHNTFTTDPRYGDSDVRRVRSLISSIEIQLVSIQDQLLKHLSAKLAMPVSHAPLDKDGFLDSSKLDIILMEAGEDVPQFIVNQNPMLDKAFEDIDLLIRQVAARLSFPISFFGLKETGGAESADAKLIRISSFLKKIGKVRDAFTNGLKQVQAIAEEWKIPVGDFMCEWGAIFPVIKRDQLDELSLAVESKLMSRRRAIMLYNDMDEATADKELALIDSENADVSADLIPA